ncbi:hypothetical protein D8798_05655 [Streptococcus cristatus]|uniref:Uncharacterized protein n=1 Tax=Streptococcus cristatus TaxID=45634 RepID=A0A428GHW9_STRCR|nr:hypothetical protein D8798_05655 [Streptococcus cristatus]
MRLLFFYARSNIYFIMCYDKAAYKLMPSSFIQLDKLESIYLRYSSTLDSYFFKSSRE